jgi:putative restriction endonuclease
LRYWWVNQNQTYRHEVAGGYLWSPKRKANGHLNPFYEFMREVAPGDVIFSFADTLIRAIGIAKSHCYECPKPLEFGSVGMYWEQVGWKIDVEYQALTRPTRPVEHMASLAPLLPDRYSPLQANGHGSQSVYLTAVPPPMAQALAGLIGHEARRAIEIGHTLAQDAGLSDRPAQALAEWEEHVRSSIEQNPTIPQTEKQQLVLSRRGQGKFRDNVSRIETHCRVTGVNRPEHLIASHCKPWRDSDNAERLDGENGLLLTPSIDHLFDRGFISFENGGELLVSPVAHEVSLRKMGVPVGQRVNVGGFSQGQRRYLEFHRESVFLRAVRRA